MISIKDLTHNITEEKIQGEEGDSVEKKTTPGNNHHLLSRGPSPNRGGTIPDFEAIGPDSESKQAWLQKRGIDFNKQVKLRRLSHMRYQHPDLNVITTFLKDFGMHVVKKTPTQRWFRGYGPDPYVYYAQEGPKKYLGGTFEVQSYADLEKALQIPGAKVLTKGVEKIEDGPGGGSMVSIEDPEGFPVNFIYGQEKIADDDNDDDCVESAEQNGHVKSTATKGKRGTTVWNTESEKPRKKAFQRYEPGPAEVYKLGHFGLAVSDFQTQLDWYTRHFNIVPSDILYIKAPEMSESTGDENDEDDKNETEKTKQKEKERIEVAVFAHINLEENLTDHHSMFLTTLAPDGTQTEPHVHHCSFEVHDLDTQFLGHQWLAAAANKSYKSVWGVGRHILGSQIFDYWWDTTGFMVEHYADGDLVNIDTPLAYGPAGHEGLAVWGPDVPKAFLD